FTNRAIARYNRGFFNVLWCAKQLTGHKHCVTMVVLCPMHAPFIPRLSNRRLITQQIDDGMRYHTANFNVVERLSLDRLSVPGDESP
ncbi:TPA: hypothetical protein ACQZJD_005419, partial [Raoultella ornithinolytica]